MILSVRFNADAQGRGKGQNMKTKSGNAASPEADCSARILTLNDMDCKKCANFHGGYHDVPCDDALAEYRFRKCTRGRGEGWRKSFIKAKA